MQLAKSVASAYDGAHMHIGDRTIGTTEPCFIIAEAGVNHNGSVALALQLVRRRDHATRNSTCMRYATRMWRADGFTSCGVVFKRCVSDARCRMYVRQTVLGYQVDIAAEAGADAVKFQTFKASKVQVFTINHVRVCVLARSRMCVCARWCVYVCV